MGNNWAKEGEGANLDGEGGGAGAGADGGAAFGAGNAGPPPFGQVGRGVVTLCRSRIETNRDPSRF